MYKQYKSHKIIIKSPLKVNFCSMNICLKIPLFILLIVPLGAISQYTDVINSNRPGLSVSAYSVGTGVVQAETGFFYEQRNHSDISRDATIMGGDLSLRYGFLWEQLELTYEGTYENQDIDFTALGLTDSRTNFSRNRLGVKYLIFDPYKDPDRNKPHLYSWRANNVFQLKNLIPAVSLYGGATFVLGDNPFYPTDPTVSPRAMVATQSKLSPRFVFITNIAYDRIGTDDPELSYLLSLQHAFRNPKWSVFLENQGIDSDRYSDILLRSGVAHLFNENFQADISLGGSFKTTPSRLFGSLGLSYRLDFHRDAPKAIDDGSGGPIPKNSMKKQRKKRKQRFKKKGKGAEDIILDPPG